MENVVRSVNVNVMLIKYDNGNDISFVSAVFLLNEVVRFCFLLDNQIMCERGDWMPL